MSDVGLDYLTLGQPLSTLSGGECQRIKLASELHKKGSVYVLDEPTTGLHMSDIGHLLEIINRLVDGGNTVIVIEHNLDVIKNADWIIDMGPEGGNKGGKVMFEGTPKRCSQRQAFDHQRIFTKLILVLRLAEERLRGHLAVPLVTAPSAPRRGSLLLGGNTT